jgi:Flp pilus assembly protein TadB
MRLNEYKKHHKKLEGLSDIQVESIFELIDLKTEDNMEKTLQKLENIRLEMKTDIQAGLNNQLKWIIATILGSAGIIIAILKF